jgi:hypothetical protein
MIFGKADPKLDAKPETNGPTDPRANRNPTAPAAAPAAMAAAAPIATAPVAAAPVAAAPAAPAAAAPTVNLRYVDRPETPETFADSITGLFFDGQTLRIEFAVTRVDEVKPNAPITGRRYPACRLVLPPGAAIDLINRMQQVGAALTQAGVVKATPRAGEAPPKAS